MKTLKLGLRKRKKRLYKVYNMYASFYLWRTRVDGEDLPGYMVKKVPKGYWTFELKE